MTTAVPEIWFLTGSQEMYGPQTLRQVAEQSREVSDRLADSGDVAARVTWRPVLTSATDILAVCREANAADSVIGVIAWMHTFSPAKMWIAGLERCASRCCICTRRPISRCHGPNWTWTS
jgi:L-arabinose isomerase